MIGIRESRQCVFRLDATRTIKYY